MTPTRATPSVPAATTVRPEPVEGLTRPSPLASLSALNAHIARVSQAAGGDAPTSGGDPWPELRSAQRFRETWERLGAEQAVVQASHRAPENAGPLNAHMLTLRTLSLMSELSPHYLRRFLSSAETLLWMEQAQGQLKSAQTSVKSGRQKAPKGAQPKK